MLKKKAHFQIREVGEGSGGTDCCLLTNQLISKSKIMGKERQLGNKSLCWYLHPLNYCNKSKNMKFYFFKEDFRETIEPHRKQMIRNSTWHDHEGKDT